MDQWLEAVIQRHADAVRIDQNPIDARVSQVLWDRLEQSTIASLEVPFLARTQRQDEPLLVIPIARRPATSHRKWGSNPCGPTTSQVRGLLTWEGTREHRDFVVGNAKS